MRYQGTNLNLGRYFFYLLSLISIGSYSTVFANEPNLEEVTCYECHDSEMDEFYMKGHPLFVKGGQEACSACHGPVDEHIDDPDVDNILSGNAATAISKNCLACHSEAGKSSILKLDYHADLELVNCLDCHDVGHKKVAQPSLLKQPIQQLCTSCHVQQSAEFQMPYTHRDMNEPMACTTCHAVHGAQKGIGIGLDATWAGLSSACMTCHSEKEGPFMFPHAPSELDGCMTCHQPHGSATPFLLTRPKVTQLCLECHGDFLQTHRDPTLGLQSCTQCHAEIHGSQRDPLLFLP